MRKSALFICLGNICRSPIAEAVFVHLVKEAGKQAQWEVDSAGIGDWHEGNLPDIRARKCMKKHGIDMKHSARQIKKTDFNKYDYIFGMDEENMTDLRRLAPRAGHRAKLELLGSYDPEGEHIIEDPYYDAGDAGFEKCYVQCTRCCKAFLEQVS